MTPELPTLPAMDDLWNLLRFESDEGRIWLERERMILLRSSEMRALRRELITSLGIEQAKGLLMRMGYLAGQKDAATARQLRPEASLFDVFSVGPQSHMMTGQAKVKPLVLDIDDDDATHFHGVFEWDHSFEAEVFLAEYGVSHEPVCWAQIGYATGFTSAFTGREILYRELGCVGCGEAVCRIEGRPVEQWEDAETLQHYYRPSRIADQLLSLQSQVSSLRDTLTSEQGFSGLIGSSTGFERVRDLVLRAADSKVTVLLLGETGVGKDMFANALHSASDRRDKPFVAVNCAAIPKELIEAELFGVVKGAYTGADESRPGRFERADGGTLFLDEVGELSLQAQAALLRALQESEIERVGDTRTRKVDVRLVAATNEDMDVAVAEGRFRADLLYRLNVYSVVVPPLRERRDDIPELAQHFLAKYSTLYGRHITGFSSAALDLLCRYEWPGNIRELANMIERGVILAEQGREVVPEHLLPGVGAGAQAQENSGPAISHSAAPEGMSVELVVEKLAQTGCSLPELERMLIAQAMKDTDGNVTRAARVLGVSRATLDYRLKKLKLTAGSFDENHRN